MTKTLSIGHKPAIEPSASYPARRYVLGLLFLLNLLLILDKIVLTTLVEPIRKEFHLTDVELGALMGLVYAIFLGAAALPLGALADRMNRRNLAAACVAVWSLMTACCGLAHNLGQLVVARIGVGIGEAGGGPSAISIISDLFSDKHRATAMSIFSMGTQFAALVNLTLMTQISHAYGWRTTLLAASVPGLLLALALRYTMSEPVRGLADHRIASSETPPLWHTLRFIGSQRSLVHLLIGATLSYLVIAGMGSWHFTFLIRSHHLHLNEIGPFLGPAIAILGVAASLSSGIFADKLAAKNPRYRLWLISSGAVVTFFLGAGSLLVQDWHWAVGLVAAFAAMTTFWFATTAALSQSLVLLRMRATIAGILFLLSNLIGYGIGPLAVGAISDALTPRFGEDSLRYALLVAVSLTLWAAFHFFKGATYLEADLAKTKTADVVQ